MIKIVLRFYQTYKYYIKKEHQYIHDVLFKSYSSVNRYPIPTSVIIYLGLAGLFSIFLLIFAMNTLRVCVSFSKYAPHTSFKIYLCVRTFPEFLANKERTLNSNGVRCISLPSSVTLCFF